MKGLNIVTTIVFSIICILAFGGIISQIGYEKSLVLIGIILLVLLTIIINILIKIKNNIEKLNQ